VEPVLGFEPRTDGLQNRCSTTELNWPKKLQKEIAVIADRFQTHLKPISEIKWVCVEDQRVDNKRNWQKNQATTKMNDAATATTAS
jgi:hypothetical protein